MARQWFVVTALEPELLIPSMIGLADQGLYAWPGAGWRTTTGCIQVHPKPGAGLPAWVRTVIDVWFSFEPVIYDRDDPDGVLEDLLDELAAAFGGMSQFDNWEGVPAERALAKAHVVDVAARDVVRAALLVDQRLDEDERCRSRECSVAAVAPFMAAAVAGDLGAVAVLEAWCRRERCAEWFFDPLCAALARVERAPDALLGVFATARFPLWHYDRDRDVEVSLADTFTAELVGELDRLNAAVDASARRSFIRRLRRSGPSARV